MFQSSKVLQFNTSALPLQFFKFNFHSYSPLIALCTGPNIFRNIFLSKVIRVFLTDFFMNGVSALKVTAWCITVLYSIHLVVALDVFLDVITLIKLIRHLLPNKIRCLYSFLTSLLQFTVDPSTYIHPDVQYIVENLEGFSVRCVLLIALFWFTHP